jgi:hypothetical protein
MALPPGSPAINAGNLLFSPPPYSDQRGYARVAGGQIDIGAFESGSSPANILSLSPTTLPAGAMGAPYNQSFTASGGTGGYVYMVTAGNLPIGLTLSPGGVLSGTTTSDGAFNFTVTVIDSAGDIASQAYALALGRTFTWTGNASTLWNDPGNWNTTYQWANNTNIPQITDDVIIPVTTNSPVLNVPGSVNALTIQVNATLGSNPGETLIVAGMLLLDGTMTVLNADVQGLLLGSGTLVGNVTVDSGAFLLPGDFNAGTLTVAGNVTFNSGGELLVIANSATNYSQLVVSGNNTVTLGSATVGVSQNYTPSGTDNLTIISAASCALAGTFNTTFPHNVSSGFLFGKGFTYGPGATVVLLDPPPQDGTVEPPPTLVKPTTATAVTLPTPRPHEPQDEIQALLRSFFGESANPAGLADVSSDPAASFARSSPVSAAPQPRSERANTSAMAINGLEAPDLDLLTGQLGDDPPPAPMDWAPSAADIDAVFRDRSADDSAAVPIGYVSDACG